MGSVQQGGQHHEEWEGRMKIKRKIHNEYVLPVMVYGSETWALKKAHMELLSVAQRKMERIMLGIYPT